MKPVRELLIPFLFLLLTTPIVAQELFRIPIVGNVTDRSATVVVWTASAATVRVEYSTSADFTGAQQSAPVTTSSANEFVAKVELQGLSASTRYHYRVVGESGTPLAATALSFQTFPAVGTDAPITVYFGSCQQRLETDRGLVFDLAAANNDADLFIHMGDWYYTDRRVPGYPTTDASMREGFAARLDTGYPFPRKILTTTPLAYVWDDHDAYGNNANGSTPADIKARVLAAYKRWVPHYPLANENGIWQSFRMGNVEFFMIDTRSQQSPIDSAIKGSTFAPPPGHSLLAGYPISGKDQRRWLIEAIGNSTARWKVLVSPLTFNPKLGSVISLALLLGRKDVASEFGEAWAGYPADIDSMKALFNEGGRRNLLVISGNIHTNLYDNGQNSVVPEFVAANLDIRNSNWADTMAKYGLTLFTGAQNNSLSTIGRIRVETTPTHRLIVESFDESGAQQLQYIMLDSSGIGGIASEDAIDGITATNVQTLDRASRLRLQLSEKLRGKWRLEIDNVVGEHVFNRTITDGGDVIEVPIGGLSNGAYVGRLSDGKRRVEFRFVVKR